MFFKHFFVLLFLLFINNSYISGVNTKDLILKNGKARHGRILSLTSKEFFFTEIIERFLPKSILFLGDANSKGNNSFSLAQTHSTFFRKNEIEVYQTDLECTNTNDKGTGIKQRKLDHRAQFPFPDNRFNIIIGSRILCACSKHKPEEVCGGLSINNNSYLSFFSEILRVLRKKKNSFAYIHGYDFNFSPEHSRKANAELERVRDILIQNYPRIRYFRIVYIEKNGVKQRAGVILGNAQVWKSGYWSRKCTACPASLYKEKHCLKSETVIDERSCSKTGCRAFCKKL